MQRAVATGSFSVRCLAGSCADFEAHSHLAYTVTVAIAGAGFLTVGETRVALQPGTGTLTNPGQVHAGRVNAFDLVSISIEPAFVEERMTEMGVYQAGAQVAFSAASTADPFLTEVAARLKSELAAEKLGRQSMVEALVQQLAVHLARAHLTVRRGTGIELSRAGPVDRRLRRALEFMHDNYADDLAPGDVARAAYLSESHFAHLFKEITGLTPGTYVANLRLERARTLLLKTDLPIGRVASQVGYQSQSHFARAFRATTGMTPSQYRSGAS